MIEFVLEGAREQACALSGERLPIPIERSYDDAAGRTTVA